MTIYEQAPTLDGRIKHRMQQLAELIATTDDAALQAEFYEELATQGNDFEAQALAIAQHINELRASQAAIKHEVDRLQQLHNERGIRAERLAAAIAEWMVQVGRQTIATDTMTLRVRLNPPAVQVVNEERIPDVYWRVSNPQPVRSVDKKGIAEAIKAGIDVPGATLTQSQKLEIR